MPCGPPSWLAPLSDISRISVFSRSPISSRNAEQAADLIVGVLEEAGERLLQAAGQRLLVGAQRLPGLDAGIAGR